MIVGGVLVFLGLALHRRVGVGQAAVAADGRVRRRPRDPRGDHRRGAAARRRGRPGARGRAVRGQLRPGRAGARGGVRRHLPQQRRPAARRARGAAGARANACRSCACTGSCSSGSANGLLERIRKRVEAAAAAVPGARPPARDGHGLLGGGVVRKVVQLAEANGFELVFTECVGPVRRAAAARRGRAPTTASCASSPTWIAGCSGARTVLLAGAGAAAADAGGRGRRPPACRRACGPTSSACRCRRDRR